MLKKIPVAFFCLLTVSSQLGLAQDSVHARLQGLAIGAQRSEDAKARNVYRHPVETLEFFGLQDDQTVVEIWPGGKNGWYRSILEPFFESQTGTYIPIMSNSSFPNEVEFIEDNSTDLVLVFRAHGFLIYDEPLNTYYEELFRMLKPGGIFGIVDHRELEYKVQDPIAENGYVQESYVIKLAQAAGFELLDSSEVNANTLDTKDYPDGLYSLPPTLRGSRFNRGLRAKVLSIGESDRMTLKFIKP